MIKAVGVNTDTGKPVLVFGLSRRNIERLVSGEPIYVKGADMRQPEIDHVLIVFGEDEMAITRSMIEAGAVDADTEMFVHSNPIDRP